MLAARRLYRARLGSTLEGLAAVEGVREVESALQDAAVVAGLVAVRQVDADFQALIDGIRADEPELDRAWELPQVARWADELTDTMAACETLCIAGGHVAVLRNRMDFFGLPGRLQGHLERGGHVVGWSAGAMLLTEQIVLYYDDPPEGPTDAEVLDRGLGLVPGLVLFPHSRLRLRIADRPRLARLTRRLAPRHCLGLEPGAWLAPEGTGWVSRGASDALVDLADPEASGHWRSR
jgi:hypothetical protein